MPYCRKCKREYTYNAEVGYSKELCGPMCDGKEMGERAAAKRCKAIAEQHYLSDNQAVNIASTISDAFQV